MRIANQRCRSLGLLLSSAILAATTALAAEETPATIDQSSDEATIREIGVKYVAAFNQKDAQALAGFWSPEAIYTNRLSGQQVIGREAIGEQFAQLFEASGDTKLEVAVTSIDFLTPNVAIETGVATFIADPPESIPYSAVYIRRDGTWLLDRVTDDPQPAIASHYEQLKPLEWMIGSWVDQGDGIAVQADCNWTKNQNFITKSFTVSVDGQVDLSGIQIIGWDAGDQQIRSWTFDSDGGFAEAKWIQNGDNWYVMKKGKTPDGKAVSGVNVITHVDDDTFRLRTVQRSVDGEILPNINEVTVVRQ
jgi:uncharacterized protein (TIGR02246 family)